MSRADFPIFKHYPKLIYLDTAATAQKPACVIDEIKKFYEEEYGTVHRALYSLSKNASALFHDARKKIASFIGALHVEEIIFTRGTTASLNLIAKSFGKAFLKPGDVILITEIEHHANVVAWQMVAKECGAILKWIPVDDEGNLILEEAAKLLKDKVKIVSLAHVSNSLGVKHPIEKLIKMAHEQGAYICIDGAQSVGHMKIDVRHLDCDFFVFSGHKTYGPTGVGVLYGKKELLEKMPPIEGGGDMIDQVRLEETSFAPLPLKFEAGTPMISSVVGLKKALDYLEEKGVERVGKEEQLLAAYAFEKLKTIPGLRVVGNGKEKGAILTFTIEGAHPLDIAMMLDCKQIALRTGHLCSQPTMRRFNVESVCRISFGIYNKREEIDQLTDALTTILKTLR